MKKIEATEEKKEKSLEERLQDLNQELKVAEANLYRVQGAIFMVEQLIKDKQT